MIRRKQTRSNEKPEPSSDAAPSGKVAPSGKAESSEDSKSAPKKGCGRRLKVFFALAISAILVAGLIQMFSPLPDRSDPALRTPTSSMDIYEEGEDLYFLPAGSEDAALGFILYPGAKVPKEAYSYLGRAVAEAGYPAVLLGVRLGFAIFDTKAASRSMAALPGVRKWVLAGHSLGGVAASDFARKHQDLVDGIVFLGSYPSASGSLAETRIRVLSISATNDMLATQEKIGKARTLLPDSTSYVRIAGGNHAQFGDYGTQKGDGAAEIPPSRQQRSVMESVLTLLASLQ